MNETHDASEKKIGRTSEREHDSLSATRMTRHNKDIRV